MRMTVRSLKLENVRENPQRKAAERQGGGTEER